MVTEIRAAQRDDVEAVMPAYDWLFDGPGYTPSQWDPDRARGALRDAIESDASSVLLAEADGVVLGICVAYIDIESVRYGRRCWIEDLAVHPDHRSRGIGTRLLAAIRDWARKRGATHLELDTGLARTDAQRFYDRQGEGNRGISYSWKL
jgi:GNAT superfamily N-acetyltransferase